MKCSLRIACSPNPKLSKKGKKEGEKTRKKNKKRMLFNVLFLASSLVSATSDVVVLTKTNFKEFVTKEPLSLIEFYAPVSFFLKFINLTTNSGVVM